jgi:hypothetical protein
MQDMRQRPALLLGERFELCPLLVEGFFLTIDAAADV